jgi:beta-galactosidase
MVPSFDDLSRFTFKTDGARRGPVVRRGTFILDDVADTYVDMREWGKGCVWLNGHSLGRYWYVGPQQTLYVPGPWLKKGRNELVVFEVIKEDQDRLQTLHAPILDELHTPVLVVLEDMIAHGRHALSVWRPGSGASITCTLTTTSRRWPQRI